MRITRDFILSELGKSVGIKVSSNSVSMLCPFHDDNKSPSLSMSLGGKAPPGVWFCFGCQEKGSWNKLALRLGLRTVDSDDVSDYDASINNRKIELFKPEQEDELNLSPLREGWKNYSIEFLNKFDAKRLWHEKYHEYFLFFPITHMGDYKGYIRARLVNDDKLGPKYWIRLEEKILYPIDMLLPYYTPVIVLVEGVSDVFRFLRYRIPTLAIFGTHSVLENTSDLLEALHVKKIIMCCDGDDPGRKANRKLAESFDLLGFDTRIFPLPEGEDPDSVPYDYIEALQKMVIRIGGKLLPKERHNT